MSNIQMALQAELEIRRRKAREEFLKKYQNDTPAFFWDLFDWDKLNSKPAKYQLEVLGITDEKGRVGAMAPRGSGKSTTASGFVLKNVIITEILGEDWKMVTTASVWRQLEQFLWPEIHKFRKLLKWDKIPLKPFNENRQIFKTSIVGNSGTAFAANSDEPELIEGAHAQHLFYVFDEAKAIKAAVFDSVEGAFSNEGNETGQIAKSFMISTPGPPEGRFWQIMTRQEGYEDWTPYYIELQDVIDSGRISQTFVEQRKKQWGEESPTYKMHILGHFPDSSESGVIPRLWILDAVSRWESMQSRIAAGEIEQPRATAMSMDVGGEGDDKTLYAIRYGKDFWGPPIEVPKVSRKNTVKAADVVKDMIRLHAKPGSTDIFHVSIDANGLGSGVFDIVNSWLGEDVEGIVYADNVSMDAFISQAKAINDWEEYRTTPEGLYKFSDRRSASWWGLREALNPNNNPSLCLPPDNTTISDLAAPRWKEMSNSFLKVESKDELRKPARLGRSTDAGDIYVMGNDVEFNQGDRVGFFAI